MTNFRIRLTAAALSLIALHTTTVNAQTATGSIDVTATVPSICVLGASTDVAFGSLSMVPGTLTQDGQGTISWACSDGQTAEIGIEGANGNGTRAMTGPGTDIPYTLWQNAARDAEWGELASGFEFTGLTGNGALNFDSIDVYGQLAGSDYLDNTPGNYTDTLVVTIEFL